MTNSKEAKCHFSVETFFLENKDRLKLTLISGKKSMQKQIVEKDLHRPGLALAGYVELFTWHRIQICGNTELSYLKKLSKKERESALKKVFTFKIPCFIITNKNKPPSEFIRLSEQYGIPVFTTPFATTKVSQLLGEYLDKKFAPRTQIHGSLVDVYGIGILLTGRSGIGKSEVALDLVARGHRLIADDVVNIERRTGGVLIGMENETLRHNMEIRGVGIIDIQAIFGIRGIRSQKRIEAQVELIDWDDSQKYERLGLDEAKVTILGQQLPLIRLPIYPGKNISVIVEVIALNQNLKIRGFHSAQDLEASLNSKKKVDLQAIKKYFGYDFD